MATARHADAPEVGCPLQKCGWRPRAIANATRTVFGPSPRAALLLYCRPEYIDDIAEGAS
jgi:hypothetical protein